MSGDKQRTGDDRSCGCGIEGHEPYCAVYGMTDTSDASSEPASTGADEEKHGS